MLYRTRGESGRFLFSNGAPLVRAGALEYTSSYELGSVNVCLVRKRPFSSRVRYMAHRIK